MKRAAFFLPLLMTTAASTAPFISEGPRNERSTAAAGYRIREVRFVGDAGFEPEVLKEVLAELKVRRPIPYIWTRRPRYDARAVDAALARLRSFYFSKGYFDARVGVADVTFEGREATVTLHVQSGRKSRVRHVTIERVEKQATIIGAANGDFPAHDLCRCLLDVRRTAEAHGRIDFTVELHVSAPSGETTVGGENNWVDVTARAQTGSLYSVGRINFSGHHRVNESTLRRAMVLQERGLFDIGKLRQSIMRLNGSGLLEPITIDDVDIQKNAADLTVDLTISVRERPRRRWLLSSPIAATGISGSLQAAISSRLPPWGRGVFEASTYYATFIVIGLPNPLVRLLPFAAKRSLSPLLVLERPYLPGQAVMSGFTLSPTQPARTLLTSYGTTHLSRGARAALATNALVPLPLLVPVQTSRVGVDSQRPVGFLVCEPPGARLRWMRGAAAYAADLALGALRPF